MSKTIILTIKGFIMGIANIIPGVSAGTLAIIMGIYEDLIDTISNFFTKIKKNIKFLTPIIIGLTLAVVIGSRVIESSLINFPLETLLFFAGLIIGGIPLLYKKIHRKQNLGNLIILGVTFITVILLTFLQSGEEVTFATLTVTDYLLLFGVGIVAAGTMIIPGISGSFMLMVLGYYEPIIKVINELTSFNNISKNITILLPFGLGVLLGIIVIAKIIEYLLHKYEVSTYHAIIGFVLASLIGLFSNINSNDITVLSTIVSSVLFIAGITVTYKLGDK